LHDYNYFHLGVKYNNPNNNYDYNLLKYQFRLWIPFFFLIHISTKNEVNLKDIIEYNHHFINQFCEVDFDL